MTQLKRPTPYPEWVQMYRSGIPATRISVLSDVAQSVIRHHLAIAARQDPGLRAAHQAAATPPPTRITGPGQRNLKVVLAFYEAEGRLPVNGRSRRESTLAEWLTRRRKDAGKEDPGVMRPVHQRPPPASRFNSAMRNLRKMMASTSAYTAKPAITKINTAYRMPRTPKAGLSPMIHLPHSRWFQGYARWSARGRRSQSQP